MIEVELGATRLDTAGTHLKRLDREAADELVDRVIVTTGREAYSRRGRVAVTPTASLGR